MVLQAAQRRRRERQRLRSSRATQCDLTAEMAAAAVSQLLPVGTSFAFTELIAPGLSLSSLSAVHRYPHLASVDVSHNFIRSLAPLSSLHSLRSLSAHNNLLLHFDLRVAASFPTCLSAGLTRLDLRSNALLQVGAIAEHAELTELRLDGNMLRSLAGVARLGLLRTLTAARNRLIDISDLDGISPHLRELDLSFNRLSGVAEVASLPGLNVLRASHNRLERLPALSRLRCLSEVEVGHNLLPTLAAIRDGLCGAPSLRTLVAQPNPYDKVDEVRLELLWLLPSLETLDGAPVGAVEKVSAQNFHSADGEMLLSIRRRHLPDEGIGAHASRAARAPLSALEDGPLLRRYRDQYRALPA